MQTLTGLARWGTAPQEKHPEGAPPVVKEKGTGVAIFHLSVKTVSRSKGRSICAAAAYRAGDEIADTRSGEIHDYIRRRGVESAELVLPADAPEWATERGKLWNAAEAAETRKNATVGREFEVALPTELTPEQRQRLAHEFAIELVERHGCAADVAIHSPGDKGGDTRNHHAHILLTTRRLGPEGLGEKTRELDDRQTGRAEVQRWRERWAELSNGHLAAAGRPERIDHRSLLDQGITRMPEGKVGHIATALERKGVRTERGEARRQARLEKQRAALLDVKRRIEGERLKMNTEEQAIEEEKKRKEARREYFERQAHNRKAAKAGAAPVRKRQGEDKPPRRLSIDELRKLSKRLNDAAEVIELPDGTYAVQFPDGSTLQDCGDHLTYQGDDYTAGAQAMLEMAKAKGWEQLHFWGPAEWRKAAITEAIRQGFPVAADEEHPEDYELIERLSNERDAQQRTALLEKFKREVEQEQESTGPRPGM